MWPPFKAVTNKAAPAPPCRAVPKKPPPPNIGPRPDIAGYIQQVNDLNNLGPPPPKPGSASSQAETEPPAPVLKKAPGVFGHGVRVAGVQEPPVAMPANVLNFPKGGEERRRNAGGGRNYPKRPPPPVNDFPGGENHATYPLLGGWDPFGEFADNPHLRDPQN